jgi:hypothetical protein
MASAVKRARLCPDQLAMYEAFAHVPMANMTP